MANFVHSCAQVLSTEQFFVIKIMRLFLQISRPSDSDYEALKGDDRKKKELAEKK
jgi:hypothetical protein